MPAPGELARLVLVQQEPGQQPLLLLRVCSGSVVASELSAAVGVALAVLGEADAVALGELVRSSTMGPTSSPSWPRKVMTRARAATMAAAARSRIRFCEYSIKVFSFLGARFSCWFGGGAR